MLLKPPTPDQIDMYDVCEEDGDLFHEAGGALVQCQRVGGDLIVHNIEIEGRLRRTGVARGLLRTIRSEYPDTRIVANGVEWLEPAGRFWKAMVEEGFVDVVVTYEHGDLSLADIGAVESAPAP